MHQSWGDSFNVVGAALLAVLKPCLHLHGAKLTVIMTWVVIGAVNPVSLANLLYLTLLVVFLPAGRGYYIWCPISFYSAALLLARYIFNFPFLEEKMKVNGLVASQDAAWCGFEFYGGGSSVAANLWGEVAIVSCATLQRVAQKYWASGLSLAAAPIHRSRRAG